MKLRYVAVAIVLAAVSACQSSPTAPARDDTRSGTDITVRADGTTAPPDSASRAGGSGWAGSGN